MTEPALTSQRSRVVIPADLDLTFQIAAEERHAEIRTAVAGPRRFLGSEPAGLQEADKGQLTTHTLAAGGAATTLLGGGRVYHFLPWSSAVH
jgi:hypothetical protein